MKISFECLYCGEKNYIDDTLLDEYIDCESCGELHDIEINDEGEVIVEEF